MTTDTDATKREQPMSGAWARADWGWFAAIVALVTLLNLPELGRPMVASHDAKSALIVRQMVEDGRWFVTDVDVGYVNKPPLFYWLGALVSRATGGVTEWAVRLPSVLACALAAGIVFAFARELWGRRAGLMAAAALATTTHFHLLAQATRLDSFVMPAVLAAVFCYWKALGASGGGMSRGAWLWSSAGHVAIALGVLAKGPVVIVFAGLVVAALMTARALSGESTPLRDLCRLHLFVGALIVVAAAGPVYVAMDRASGGRFLGYFFLREHLARAGVAIEDVGEFHHSYPVWYYAATIWFGAAPWSLFLPLGFVAAWRARATRWLPILYFALPFLFLSLVPYKKWPYLMTIYPPLAMLVAKAWLDASTGALGTDRLTRVLLRGAAGVMVVAALAAALFGAGVLDAGILGKVAGPDGLIHARRALALPEELEAVRGRVFSGALPLWLAAAALVTLAAMLWRLRASRAMAILLGLAIAGSLYNDFVIRPAVSARASQKFFAERVNAWAEARPGRAPIRLCAGEAFELRLYLRSDVRPVRPEECDAFLGRLRPTDAAEGEPVLVILPRKWPELAQPRTGRLDVVLATGKDESVKSPVVMVEAKLTAQTGAPGPQGR